MGSSPEALEWVEMAEQDAEAGRILSESGGAGLGWAVLFHYQQAAEKYLKACLTQGRIYFPKTHDLEELLRLARPLIGPSDSLLEAAQRLQPFAVCATPVPLRGRMK